MRNFLSNLVATITRNPRYFPEFEWSNKLYVHNIFRFLGSIFGEHYGIRTSIVKIVNDERSIEMAFTLEAQLALVEVWVRSLFSKYALKWVLIPQPQLVGFGQNRFSSFFDGRISQRPKNHLGLSPYRFALAFDNAVAQATGSSPSTFSYTVTGSNPALGVLAYNNGNTADNVSGVTYNSIALTKEGFSGASTFTGVSLWSKLGPSTGSNSLALTWSGGVLAEALVASYTGVDQTLGINVSNVTGAPVTSTVSNTIVTTSNGCWGVSLGVNGSGTVTAGTNINSVRVNSSNYSIGDSNGSLGTAGSYTLSWNQSVSQNLGSGALGLLPASAAVIAGGFFTNMMMS